MIHLNLVVKNSHSSFDILFSLLVPRMCTQPNWLCHQSITTKLNMKILFPKMVMAPIIHKKLCNFFKMWQCDWNHSNTHAMKSFFFFFFFFFFFGVLIFLKCLKKVWKENNGHFFFWEKNSLDLQKIKNHVVTFPYWFWLGNKFLKGLIGS